MQEPITTVQLDPIALLQHASGPVKITVALLLFASTLVWAVAVIKAMQIGRMRRAEQRFEDAAALATTPAELLRAVEDHRVSPGARIVHALVRRAGGASLERARAVAERAIVQER